tara:strand:+ start:890 stop:1330 length:441 start_codon:yes stop_codon:yes gene_type:complete
MKHPYIIGLEYGWGDDALNTEGHGLLSRLSDMFSLTAETREIMEMDFVETLPLISQGVGAGTIPLRAYVNDLEKWFPNQSHHCARYLGRIALDVGMTKHGWKNAFAWMESIGLGTSFAMGAWMQGEEPEKVEIPRFFDDIVAILGV